MEAAPASSVDWTPEVEEAMRLAGWFPGRDRPDLVDTYLTELPEFSFWPECALQTLREFGGLEPKLEGMGRDWSRGHFVMDPIRCAGEHDRFAAAGRIWGRQLAPLGEALHGHGFFGIDAVGRVYMVADDAIMVGLSSRDAIARTLLGIRCFDGAALAEWRELLW